MKDHDTAGSGSDLAADLADRDCVTDSWGRAAAYDAYADGLHTYALGGLRNHEAAASAVYCAFVAADHHVAHLSDADVLRPWLYAITRHYCRQGKLPRLGLTSAAASWDPGESGAEALAGLERSLLVAELASLDWPDTDGLQVAHREVLELSVRHGMESRAVGLMLACPAEESFELLAQAWTELERSLAATALLRTSREHCGQLAALASEWTGRLTARTREPLVSHVDTCSHCQYYLHTVIGTPQAPTILPHVAAPRALRARVLGDLLDTGAARASAKAAIAGRLAVFDQWGFPAVGGSGVRTAGGPGEPGSGVGSGVVTGAAESGSTSTSAAALSALSSSSGSSSASSSVSSSVSSSTPRRGTGHGSVTDRRSASLPAEAIATALDGPPSRTSRRAADTSTGDRSHRRTRPPSVTPTSGPTNRRSTSLGTGSISAEGVAVSEGRRASHSSTPAMTVEAAASERPKASRHRKSGFRTLGGSVMLSGAGAAGLTAFVVLASAGPSHTTLFADPENGGATQGPDAPQATGLQGGEPIPVSGGGAAHGGPTAQTGGNPGPVSAQIVAAVVTSAPAGAPGGVEARSGTEVGSSAAGRLTVAVEQRAGDPGEVTVTLGDSGTGPVAWTATPDVGYLRLSDSSGVVQPGGRQSVTVSVDQASAPASAWQAHVRFDPGGATVVVHGTGNAPVSTSEPSAPGSKPTSSPAGTTGSSAPASAPSSTGATSSPSTAPSTTPTTPATRPTSAPSTEPTPTTPSAAPTSAGHSSAGLPAPTTAPTSAHATGHTPAPTGSPSADHAATPSSAATPRQP